MGDPCSHSLSVPEAVPGHPVGTGYSPRASLSPAEQEQRVASALSLHPGPVRVMHRALATTTTPRPHLQLGGLRS